jgi:hypothetical protein
MNTDSCVAIVDSYVAWLRAGLTSECAEDACELTTPFLDRHNDHLQVYAQRHGNEITLSDDGYVLADLRASGLEFSTEKRRQLLQATLNGFGVRVDHGQLTIEASERTVGQRLHALVQAMLAVNDMFMMAQSRIASVFLEDVRQFLEDNDVRFSERVKITGRSGFDHAVDFLIPSSRQRPERILQVINSPSKNSIGACLFALSDTRDARGAESRAYAALNDTSKPVSGDVLEALRSYSVEPLVWSHRESFVQALVS